MESSVEEILKQNQDLICKIISEQNILPYNPDIKTMNDLYKNILKLASTADNLPDTRKYISAVFILTPNHAKLKRSHKLC